MILYSFRRCPWAMRARLALRYAGCPVEIHEVSLKAKPVELLALSPKGTVPVLDTGTLVLEESLDIMRWALAQHDPQDWRLEADPQAARQADALIARNDSEFKQQVNLYKYAERYPEHSREYYRQQAEPWLAELEGLLEGRPYLLCAHPSLADAALLPLMRQFAGVEPQWFAEAAYPRLRSWLQGWLESALFKAVMARDKSH
ncbi:glutathione S-transferase [Pseudomonas sp. X10]